jgi:DNA-binding transcriptional ArsR family regulator
VKRESSSPEVQLATLAAAIADPARARMLCSLLDGQSRTATELAAVSDVSSSSASGHLMRLRNGGLVDVKAQGKHRYFRLASHEVAAALEALQVVAGGQRMASALSVPAPLRQARTCYDHMAGTVGVRMHDALLSRRWLVSKDGDYELSPAGERSLSKLGINVDAVRRHRRRFAFPCMDWSERRPHLGGALGAALLDFALAQRWVSRALDSRALRFTPRSATLFENTWR